MGRAASQTEVDREVEILTGAERIFVRDGFRLTSMADVARETGMSRAGLYKRFATKEELFRAVVAQLHEITLAAVDEIANKRELDLPTRLSSIFEARIGFFLERHRGAAHGADLTSESGRICGDITAGSARRFRRSLAAILRDSDRAGEIDLASAQIGPRPAANLLAAAVNGLKHEPTATGSRRAFRRQVDQLVRTFVRGLGGA